MLCQLFATLLQAIIPQPALADLNHAWGEIQRNLHEPPRKKRGYQTMPALF
jgi:hypothetical protein